MFSSSLFNARKPTPVQLDMAGTVDIADSMAGMDKGMGNKADIDNTAASQHRITMEPLPTAVSY